MMLDLSGHMSTVHESCFPCQHFSHRCQHHLHCNMSRTKMKLQSQEVSLLNQEVIVEKKRSFNEAGTYQEQAVDSSPISSVAANKVSPMNNTSTSDYSRLFPSSNPKETADLTSVQELINEFECGCHSGLLDIVRNRMLEWWMMFLVSSSIILSYMLQMLLI